MQIVLNVTHRNVILCVGWIQEGEMAEEICQRTYF
jgi:hypothetical protein